MIEKRWETRAYFWTEAWMLQHDRGVAELLDKTILPLDGSVGDLGDLVTAELIPGLCQKKITRRT